MDAVRPDPASRYGFESAVKRLLANPQGDAADREMLSAWLTRLYASVPAAQKQIQASPRLAEISTRANQLLELTAMGQQALGYLADGRKAPAGWKARQNLALDEIRKPSAIIRFTILEGVSNLVQAVPE